MKVTEPRQYDKRDEKRRFILSNSIIILGEAIGLHSRDCLVLICLLDCTFFIIILFVAECIGFDCSTVSNGNLKQSKRKQAS